MHEGWRGDDYLILFAESEIGPATDRYAFSEFLPGCRLIGLRSWDDFIVRDSAGQMFLIPTVPVDLEYLEPFSVPVDESGLQPDPRFVGKLKWYLKPLVFGGDANIKENCVWISHDQHAQFVRFWNDKYRSQS